MDLQNRNDEIEVYKQIDDFLNYSVSNFGNVKNNRTGRILKPDIRSGYYYICLFTDNKKYKKYIHKLVAHTFLNNLENKKCIDHINSDKLDNSLFNLRYATHQENSRNAKISSKNTSGVKGVGFSKKSNKWKAHITIDYKQFHLGYFDDLEDAKIARQTKSKEVHGDFLNACEK